MGLGKIDSLLIVLDLKEHMNFAYKVKDRAHELGIKDVFIHALDLYEIKEMLKKTSIEDISLENSKVKHLIDKSKWNEYAKKHGGILFVTSEVPGLMNDVDQAKIQKRMMEGTKTNEYYRENRTTDKFNWTIAAMPNLEWSQIVFPNDKNSYEKLYLHILKACMVDLDDPIKAWNEYAKKINDTCDVLNSLDIKRLHYYNKLGTDLYLDMPDNHIWLSALKAENGVLTMDNMPSYEIFSSPDYRNTNGIVYASKPLVFEGSIIDDFYFVFDDGKVVDFDARVGNKMLNELLNTKSNDSIDQPDYLGEVAFVEHDSPISNTGLIFYNTLFDENASCHLALGDSFPDALKCGVDMTREELLKNGLNQANSHVDFMIGTDDLVIEAETNNGIISIIEDGNFSKTLK